jgi:hypothetical protein
VNHEEFDMMPVVGDVRRASVTEKIKHSLSQVTDKTKNKMHQTSEILKAGSVVLKGSMSTVGGKLKTVIQNINCGGNLESEREMNLSRSAVIAPLTSTDTAYKIDQVPENQNNNLPADKKVVTFE